MKLGRVENDLHPNPYPIRQPQGSDYRSKRTLRKCAKRGLSHLAGRCVRSYRRYFQGWLRIMKILIACEESQAVCVEMRKAGHEAYSCDTQECSGGYPDWHIQGDVLEQLHKGWDMMIAHPPCTYLTNAGVCHLHKDPRRWLKLFEAGSFFKKLMNAPIEKIAVENPIMHKYGKALIGDINQSQVIQPWMFGHKEQKATCLWLKNLPKLTPTDDVKKEMMNLPKNQRERIHYLPPGPDRAKLRSKTFLGIAKAMAEQWG